MSCGLPGAIKKIDHPISDHCCETEGHEDRMATHRLQGETDSFGAEYSYYCAECIDQYRGTHWLKGPCEHCGTDTKLWGWRDPEEGMCGPVYAVCQPCIQKANTVF